jgi:hypothetical protein
VFANLLLESFDERLDLRVQLLRCRRRSRRHRHPVTDKRPFVRAFAPRVAAVKVLGFPRQQIHGTAITTTPPSLKVHVVVLYGSSYAAMHVTTSFFSQGRCMASMMARWYGRTVESFVNAPKG